MKAVGATPFPVITNTDVLYVIPTRQLARYFSLTKLVL